jgi:hypothetical protein
VSEGTSPHATDNAENWSEVDDWINARIAGKRNAGARTTIVYRGSGVGRKLESSLRRRGEDYAERERRILAAFKRYAYRSGRPEWSDWEWLALAQHHGLPTRAIDFTFSPLIALHFATLTKREEPSILWAVDYQAVHEYLPPALCKALEQGESKLFGTEQLAQAAPSLDDFDAMAKKDDFVVFWEPPSLDERIVNQSAVFAVMTHATSRFEEWLDQHPKTASALRLSAGAKKDVRKQLDLVGITERLLFPDLTGLAAWVARYYDSP